MTARARALLALASLASLALGVARFLGFASPAFQNLAHLWVLALLVSGLALGPPRRRGPLALAALLTVAELIAFLSLGAEAE